MDPVQPSASSTVYFRSASDAHLDIIVCSSWPWCPADGNESYITMPIHFYISDTNVELDVIHDLGGGGLVCPER